MKEQPELKVVEVETSSLVPYLNNANVHSNLQIEQIANSIEEFGFCDPIGVWENDKGEPEIVEGHGRLLAAKKLGFDKVPVIYLNALSDEQRRAYTHVHNQLTRNSEFDWNILNSELDNLEFDWDDFGFDALEISDNLEFEPDKSERDIIDEYAKAADENVLQAFNVIIACMGDDEKQQLKEILGIPEDDDLKRFYRVEELDATHTY